MRVIVVVVVVVVVMRVIVVVVVVVVVVVIIMRVIVVDVVVVVVVMRGVLTCRTWELMHWRSLMSWLNVKSLSYSLTSETSSTSVSR